MSRKTRIVKMPANALEDAVVDFISLVDRPANRIPYRIMKAEDMPVFKNEETESFMFNLSNVLKRKTSVPGGPAVAAVVIRKADLEALLPQLTEKGIAIADQVEQEDVVILKQMDYAEADVTAFKMNDDVVVLVTEQSDVVKAFEPFVETADFDENVKIAGFMPGLHMATEALFDTYRSILIESKSKSEAATQMKAAIGSYAGFVTSLADNLPEMAFKLETIVLAKDDIEETSATETGAVVDEASATKSVAGDEGEGTGEGAAAAEETQTADTTAEKTDAEVTAEAEAEAAAGATESAAKEEGTEKKDEIPELAVLLGTFKSEIMEGITGVQTELADIKTTAGALNDRLDAVEKVAKAADEAVRGTVQSGSDIRDETLGTLGRAQKTEADDELWGNVLCEIVPGS